MDISRNIYHTLMQLLMSGFGSPDKMNPPFGDLSVSHYNSVRKIETS